MYLYLLELLRMFALTQKKEEKRCSCLLLVTRQIKRLRQQRLCECHHLVSSLCFGFFSASSCQLLVFWFLQCIILSAPCVLVSTAHHLVSSLCFGFFSASSCQLLVFWFLQRIILSAPCVLISSAQLSYTLQLVG